MITTVEHVHSVPSNNNTAVMVIPTVLAKNEVASTCNCWQNLDYHCNEPSSKI
jgi:hypothetical protein